VNYLSVCSGIEAASVAWHPLGWKPVGFAEIEPFPSAVLAHHYPTVPNFGDMTQLHDLIEMGICDAPEILVGGTPCQAFSVAGLRKSLDDARGNLSLVYCDLANAIDLRRRGAGLPPAVLVWENVPGVLSTKDNAFGCFLAGLAGEDEPLVPTGKRWPNAGYVLGPQRAVAWRILDAQYFGLAQRRRRVFVVASARDGLDPATVLFEWEGVRRDSAPSREAGKESAARTARSVALRGREGGGTAELGDELQNCLRASGGGGDKPHVLIHADPIARCVTAGEAKRQDWETCNFVAHSLRGEGFDASEDGTGRGTPLVPVAFNARQDPDHWHDRTGPLDTDGGTQAVSYAIQAGALAAEPGMKQTCYVAEQPSMQVRRLTPVECERLQGFQDNYTRIPWKLGYWPADKHPPEVRAAIAEQCPDGPRYKALGNSMAVPCMRWIGSRIAAHLQGELDPPDEAFL